MANAEDLKYLGSLSKEPKIHMSFNASSLLTPDPVFYIRIYSRNTPRFTCFTILSSMILRSRSSTNYATTRDPRSSFSKHKTIFYLTDSPTKTGKQILRAFSKHPVLPFYFLWTETAISNQKTKVGNAIYCYKDYGPYFGKADLYVYSKFSDKHTSQLNKTYAIEKEVDDCRELFGSYKFYFLTFEVYKLVK